MRNTGILLILVGLYVVINSGSFRDLVRGQAEISFLKPAKAKVTSGKSKKEEVIEYG